MFMLMHEGCCTIKCGSMTCRNYDDTCVGGRILVINKKLITKQKKTLVGAILHKNLRSFSTKLIIGSIVRTTVK